MLNSDAVSQHLPFMRRYARALAGRQSSGDAYGAAALEAVLADREAIRPGQSVRVGLYKVLTSIWNSVDLNDVSDPTDSQLPVERRLGHISRVARAALPLGCLG